MMTFREVKNAAIALVGDYAEGRFRVIGYQGQSKSAKEIVGNNRLVQIYYSEGSFPKGAGGFNTSKTHDITLEVDMSVSAKAKGDLSILDSQTATEIQKANALASIQEASKLADDSIDEVIDATYQILMDARFSGLRMEKGIVASRWIDAIRKDTTIEHGDLVVKTANMKYTCRIEEEVSGAIGNRPETVIIDSSISIGDTEGAGVENEIDNT